MAVDVMVIDDDLSDLGPHAQKYLFARGHAFILLAAERLNGKSRRGGRPNVSELQKHAIA